MVGCLFCVLVSPAMLVSCLFSFLFFYIFLLTLGNVVTVLLAVLCPPLLLFASTFLSLILIPASIYHFFFEYIKIKFKFHCSRRCCCCWSLLLPIILHYEPGEYMCVCYTHSQNSLISNAFMCICLSVVVRMLQLKCHIPAAIVFLFSAVCRDVCMCVCIGMCCSKHTSSVFLFMSKTTIHILSYTYGVLYVCVFIWLFPCVSFSLVGLGSFSFSR